MAPDSKNEQHGLFILYPPLETVHTDVDTVCIHGLGGDAFRTWTADNGKMWPRDIIPEIMPSARVMTFGYDSKWAFSPSVADIKDFATDLLSRLRSKRWSTTAVQRPIIFVCHSLGGIVCKKALILAKTEQYYINIFEKTLGILFFGTPHRGSRVASWATVMSNFINTCTFHTPLRKQLLKDLKTSSVNLAEISSSFAMLASNFEIKTFYETLMMLPLKGSVVERDSAILNLVNEQCIPIAANHREIVHFTSIESQKFDPVKGALQELKDGKPIDQEEMDSAYSYLGVKKDYYFGTIRGGLLSEANYDQELSTTSDRAPGTCEWLVAHPSFSNWLSAASTDFLWLRGYAGVGKSVIAKYLITSVIGSKYVRSIKDGITKKVENSPHESFSVYFFCKETKRALRTEESLLRSLLHQLLLGAPLEVTQTLLKLRSKTSVSSSYPFLESSSGLWDAVEAGLVAIPWKFTYLVLDALDEMLPEDFNSSAQGIRNLVDTVAPRIMPRSIKVLILSRPSLIVEQAISPPSISVKSERDVRHMIEHRAWDLSRQYRLSSDVRQQIIEQICQKAGAMFLWASLAWEELCKGAKTQSQFLGNLGKAKTLPSTLESLYADILDRFDSEKLSLTLRAFAWLTAASRPLHSNELRFAIAMDTDVGDNIAAPQFLKL